MIGIAPGGSAPYGFLNRSPSGTAPSPSDLRKRGRRGLALCRKGSGLRNRMARNPRARCRSCDHGVELRRLLHVISGRWAGAGALLRCSAPEWCPLLDVPWIPLGVFDYWSSRDCQTCAGSGGGVVEGRGYGRPPKVSSRGHRRARCAERLVLGLWSQAGIWSSLAAPVRTTTGPASGRALLVAASPEALPWPEDLRAGPVSY